MSKITKLINNPKLFFSDMINKPKSKITPKPKQKVKPAVKDISYYRDQLLEFKNKYPVNSIKYNDIHLWPVLRFGLWRGLRDSWQNNEKISKIIPLKTTLSKYAYDSFKNDYKFIELKNLKDEIQDFLVFSNVRGVEQTIVNKKTYNKYTDPIYEELIKIGNTLKIQIIKGDGPINMNMVHTPLSILPPLTREVGYFNISDMPHNLLESLQNHFKSLNIAQKDLNDTIEWFMRDYNLYREILLKTKPKTVFFMGFEFHLALSAAANDLGIKSVDIQHGLQTGWGPLYKWWEEIPPCGYNTLPTDFLIWGNRDKKHLNNEIAYKNNSNIHICGFPWIEKQFEYSEALATSTLKYFNKYKIKVLISLQHQNELPRKFEELFKYSINNIKNNLNNQIIKLKEKIDLKSKELEDLGYKIDAIKNNDMEILKVIKNDQLKLKEYISNLTNELEKINNEYHLIENYYNEDEILWILRKHPKGKNISKSFIPKRDNIYISNDVNNVQIGMLLKKIDIHITSSSTVVIEADYFGVLNFIADDDNTGIENYQEEIDEGVVQLLNKPRDFYDFINDYDFTDKKRKIDAINRDIDINKVLEDII